MAEEAFSPIMAPLFPSGLNTAPRLLKQVVILTNQDGIAFFRQMPEKSQTLIALQDNMELKAREKISANTVYQDLIINFLCNSDNKNNLGIERQSDKEIRKQFLENWDNIFAKNNKSLSNSLCDFCQNTLKSSVKRLQDLKPFIDKFWSEWANTVTLPQIKDNKCIIFVVSPKVAGNSEQMALWVKNDVSLYYFYTGDSSHEISTKYLERIWTNKSGETGLFFKVSKTFTNLSLDKLKSEVTKRTSQIQETISSMAMQGKEVKELSIQELPTLFPEHQNVLREAVNSVLLETQTQTLSK